MQLFLLWFSHVVMDFFWGIWPIFKVMFNLDIAKVGILTAIAGFCGEACQLIFGHLSDKGYSKKLLILSFVFSGCILFLPLTNSYLIYFFLLLLFNLGSGAYHPAAASIASQFSAKRKGLMITLFTSGGYIGVAFSQIAFIFFYHKTSGHIYLFLIPVYLLLFILKKTDFAFARPTTTEHRFLKMLIPFKDKKASIVLLYFSQVAHLLLFFGSIFLLPELLKSFGYPQWYVFGVGHMVCVLGMALVMIPVGYLADMFGEKKLVHICSILSLVIFYFLLFFPPVSLVRVSILLFALGGVLGSLNPMFLSYGHKLFPKNTGTVSAILMGFSWCAVYLSFGIIGVVVKKFGVQTTMLGMGSLIFVPIILMSLESVFTKKQKRILA